MRLAHRLGVKAFSYRRVKNDQKDAADLADLLRMGRLPEAWIAPPEVRELRELTRYRIKLVRSRASGKDQVHAVLAKLGIPVTCTDLFGAGGSTWLDGAAPAAAICGQGRFAAAADQRRPGEQARRWAARDRPQVWPAPGGAAAPLIDPAARTRTAPCPRGQQPREPRRDDRSQAPAHTRLHPGPEHNHIPPLLHTPLLSRRPIIGARPGASRTPAALATPAGLRPVLDLPARSPETAATGKQELPRPRP